MFLAISLQAECEEHGEDLLFNEGVDFDNTVTLASTKAKGDMLTTYCIALWRFFRCPKGNAGYTENTCEKSWKFQDLGMSYVEDDET